MGHSCQANQAKKFHSAYINSFVTSLCAPDLLLNKLFPNGKEVTETWAMFEATRHLGPGYEWNNPNVLVYVIGDGVVPRTAAMFAFRTKWIAKSVDPAMRPVSYEIQRLNIHRIKVEDFESTADWGDRPILIVLPHSHAKIKHCLEKIESTNRAVISMDCCVNQIIPGKAPDVEYEDDNVWSKKNIIRVWRNV